MSAPGAIFAPALRGMALPLWGTGLSLSSASRAGGRGGSFARILLLSWNLFHGRSEPAAGRPLLVEFCRALAGWSWDVALLQEVPPWWPSKLAAATGASARFALTSRNSGRCRCAVRSPSATPTCSPRPAAAATRCSCAACASAEHRTRELTREPERRVMHGVLVDGSGWVVNLHASTHPPEQRRADSARRGGDGAGVGGRGAAVFGGDLNSTRPAMPGVVHVRGHHVDHFFMAGPGGGVGARGARRRAAVGSPAAPHRHRTSRPALRGVRGVRRRSPERQRPARAACAAAADVGRHYRRQRPARGGDPGAPDVAVAAAPFGPSPSVPAVHGAGTARATERSASTIAANAGRSNPPRRAAA